MVRKTLPVRKLRIFAGLLHMLGQDPGGNMFEKIKRQVQEMAKGPAGYPQINLVGGMQQQDNPEENQARH